MMCIMHLLHFFIFTPFTEYHDILFSSNKDFKLNSISKFIKLDFKTFLNVATYFVLVDKKTYQHCSH